MKKKKNNQEEIYRLQTRLPVLHKPTKPSSPAPGGSLPGAPIHNQPEGCFSAEPQKIHLLLFTSIYTRHQATLLTPARQHLSGATSPGGDPGAGSQQHAVAGEAAPGSSMGLGAGPVPASTTCGGTAGARARSSELLHRAKRSPFGKPQRCCCSSSTAQAAPRSAAVSAGGLAPQDTPSELPNQLQPHDSRGERESRSTLMHCRCHNALAMALWPRCPPAPHGHSSSGSSILPAPFWHCHKC